MGVTCGSNVKGGYTLEHEPKMEGMDTSLFEGVIPINWLLTPINLPYQRVITWKMLRFEPQELEVWFRCVFPFQLENFWVPAVHFPGEYTDYRSGQHLGPRDWRFKSSNLKGVKGIRDYQRFTTWCSPRFCVNCQTPNFGIFLEVSNDQNPDMIPSNLGWLIT